MCSLCQVAVIPLEFLMQLFILLLSYIFLAAQMAVMFIFRFIEYHLHKIQSK